jgi:MFS family permease
MTTPATTADPDPIDPAGPRPWLTPGVRGIGLASLLADLGHEIPTALLPSFLTSVLGAPAAALGIIEGVADALSGVAKFIGGPLADDPQRRRSIAVGGYTLTALLSAATGLASAAWQVGILRAGAWTARGIRNPARNALLADAVDQSAFGRAYGFERAMDNLGAVFGPILALALVAAIGVREAILLSVIPGLLAAGAIVYAVRHLEQPKERHTVRPRIVVRPLLRGRLGVLLIAVALFEAGNVAASLLILRTTELLTPGQGLEAATTTAIALYVGYNIAATLVSIPAGRAVDTRGPRLVFGLGIAAFALAYAIFAVGPAVAGLAVGFVAAGIGIGAAETAQRAAVATLAPTELRGSAFGLLATIQSVGDLVASATVGLVWTLVAPSTAFGLATIVMVVALGALVVTRGRGGAAT